MKDNRNTPLLPDLSRYIKTVTSGTLYLETLCHYRFSEYSSKGAPSFDDRSAKNMLAYTVTGSVDSAAGAYSPVITTFNSPVLNSRFGAPFITSMPGQGLQTVRATFPISDGPHSGKAATNAILPFSNQFLNFDKLASQRIFLAGERYKAAHMDASQLPSGADGYTYMLRYRLTGATVSQNNNLFCIGAPNKASIAVAAVAGTTNLTLTYVKKDSNGSYFTKTVTLTSGVTSGVVNGSKWLVLFFSVTPAGIRDIRLYDMHTGETQAAAVTDETNAYLSYSSPTATPTLYFGYGDPAPSTSFLPADFLTGYELLEFATFKGTIGTSTQQAIAKSSRANPKSRWSEGQSILHTGQPGRSMLYGTDQGPFRSGFNNIPVRRTLQAFDARQTIPTIKRSGDPGRRIGSGTIKPFDDTRTLIFGTTQSLMYPEMIPTYFFSGSSASASAIALQDVHKTVFHNRLTASAALYSSIQDKTTLVMNRGLGTTGPDLGGVASLDQVDIRSITNTSRDSAFGGIMEPFKDHEPSHDTYYINASGTLDSVLPGFDSRLGDKIAIIIPLDVDVETTAGTIWDTGEDPDGNPGGAMSLSYTLSGGPALKARGKQGERNPIMYYNRTQRKWIPPAPVSPANTSGSKAGIPDVSGTGFKNAGWCSPNFDENTFTKANTFGAGLMAVNMVPCGFLGTTGFCIYPSSSDPCGNMQSRGRFTDFFGFPFEQKYAPSGSGCKIRMSEYISEPFLLEHVIFEVSGSTFEAGPDCLGLKMGKLENWPASCSIGTYPASSTDTVPETQDGARIFQRAGVIGGGDMIGAVPTWRRTKIIPATGLDQEYTLPASPYTAHDTGGSGTTYNMSRGLRIFTCGQSFIAPTTAVTDPSNTVITRGVSMFTDNGHEPSGATMYPAFVKFAWNTSLNVSDGDGDAAFWQMMAPAESNIPVLRIPTSDKPRWGRGTTAYASPMTIENSSSPFWRCDTFFLLRSRNGKVSGDAKARTMTTHPQANGCYTFSTPLIMEPRFAATQAGPIDGGSILIDFSGKVTSDSGNETQTFIQTSSQETRELITYNQIVHYGYVAASEDAQGLADGLLYGTREATGRANPKRRLRVGMVSSPDTIIKGSEKPDTGIKDGGVPKSHWDYTYHGSFEDASYDSSYPKADQKGTSRPWLDAGLGRDLNLYINNGGQYGSGQHTSDLEAGYITPTSASNAAFQDIQYKGTTSTNAYAYHVCWLSSSLNYQRIKVMTGQSGDTEKDISDMYPLSRGMYRVGAPCRQAAIASGLPPVTVQYTSNGVNEVPPNHAIRNGQPYYFTVQDLETHHPRGCAPELTSGRSATAAAPGVTPAPGASKFPVMPGIVGVSGGFTVTAGTPGQTASSSSLSPDSYGFSRTRGQQTYDAPSPYVLLPEDDIIVGFNVAMPGGNPGNPAAINAYPGAFSPSAKYFSGRNQARMDYFDHRFVFAKGQSRLILYGSLVKDNKEKMPSSNQPLYSDSVREALHDGDVLDQFTVASIIEFSGSYVSQLVGGGSPLSTRQRYRGTHINPQYNPYGMSGSLGQNARRVMASGSAMGISGSFNRFVTLVDDSEVYYDSLMPNFAQIWAVDNAAPAPILGVGYLGATEIPVVAGSIWATAAGGSNAGGPHNIFADAPQAFWQYHGAPAGGGSGGQTLKDIGYANNDFWKDSFPFEQKYSSVDRLTDDSSVFGTTGSFSTVGFGRMGRDKGSPGPYATALNSVTVNLLAEVRTPGGGAYGKATNDRNFAPTKAVKAALCGYGRNNRKYLDLMHTHRAFQNDTANATYYYGLFDHPVGVKYGLANFDKMKSRSIFRYDRYGQFRDMLEQRRYTRFFEEGDNDNPRGLTDSVVNCIFVDADGAPITDTTTTTCFNLSTAATSSKPYFEGETPTRTIIFTSRFVAVDFSAADTTRFRFP